MANIQKRLDKILKRGKIKEKELKDYACYFCQHKFQKYVGQSIGNKFKGKSKGGCSTQVICPKCENFIKTWD